MAYSQDTITNVNAPNVLAGILHGHLVAEGWEVVEELTPTGTFKSSVYKSPATLNQCGYDWYLAIMWNSVGTEQRMEVLAGSGYDVGTHTLSGITNSLSGTGNSPAYSDLDGTNVSPRNVNVATTAVGLFSTHGQNIYPTWFALIVPSSAFAYWASITLDHVALYTTITPGANQTANFIAATLDVSPDWATHGFAVVENPVVSFGFTPGISGSVPGTGTINSNYRNPTVAVTDPVGSVLPLLSNEYLAAFAWRPDFYLDSIVGVGSGWSNTGFGDGFLIGSAIDFYMVSGGSIGDTVTIDSATYVLSDPLAFGNSNATTNTKQTIAVLVEP